MEFIFATANPGKLLEVREICSRLGEKYGIHIDVSPMPQKVDIPETGSTYEENALIKAQWVWKHYGKACIADDSGMEVDALDKGPGIYTARYCDRNFADGIEKLLHELDQLGAKSPEQRRASFECCICMIDATGVARYFHGHCPGTISATRCGNGGFGFDPVFIADATPGTCMAELEETQKNTISHRGLALEEMFRCLKDNKLG